MSGPRRFGVAFFLTLAGMALFFSLVFLCTARFSLVMATGMAAVLGPLSGLLWDGSSGLRTVATGLGAVVGLAVIGTVVFKQPEFRMATAVVAALLWFGFGGYGVAMLG